MYVMRIHTRPEDRNVERRSRPRRRTLLAARLYSGNPAITISCGIRNLSDTGAQIELESPTYLRPPFRLLMVKDGTIHEADLVWSWGKTLGFSFTATHEAQTPVPEELKIIRILWSTTRA